jgi:hypothetical protein
MIRPVIQKIIDDLTNNPDKWVIGNNNWLVRKTGPRYGDKIDLPAYGNAFSPLGVECTDEETIALSNVAAPILQKLKDEEERKRKEDWWKDLEKKAFNL